MSEQQKYYLLVMHNMLLDNGIELGKCEDGDGYCIVRYHDEYYDNPYEDEKFRTVSDLMPVLDTYLNDSYFADLEEMSEGFGIDWSHENVPETCEEWVNFLNEHQEIKEICQYEYEVMDMIANHMDEINFKKLYELHEGEPLYRIKERNARYEAMEQIQNHPDEVTTLEQFPMKDVGNTYITVKKNPEAENEFLFDVCADKLMSKELGFIKGDLKEVLHALADGSAELFHQDFIRTRATASELIDKGIVKAKNPLNSHPIPEAMSESLIDSLLISRIGTEPIEDVSSNPYVKDVASILRYDIKEFVEDVLPYHQARVDRADCRSNEEHAEYLIARAFLRYSDNLKHHPVCQENDGDWNANIQMKHEGENAILSIEVYKGCKCLAEINQSLETKEVSVQEFACSEEQSKMILNALQKLEISDIYQQKATELDTIHGNEKECPVLETIEKVLKNIKEFQNDSILNGAFDFNTHHWESVLHAYDSIASKEEIEQDAIHQVLQTLKNTYNPHMVAEETLMEALAEVKESIKVAKKEEKSKPEKDQ